MEEMEAEGVVEVEVVEVEVVVFTTEQPGS